MGSGDYMRIAEVLKKVTDGQKFVSVHKAGYLADADETRISLTPKHSRYLKISEGCDHTCSFCVIPSLRGRYRSRHIADLLKESGYDGYVSAEILPLPDSDQAAVRTITSFRDFF